MNVSVNTDLNYYIELEKKLEAQMKKEQEELKQYKLHLIKNNQQKNLEQMEIELLMEKLIQIKEENSKKRESNHTNLLLSQSKDEIDMEELEKKELIGRELEKNKQILLGLNEIELKEIEDLNKIVIS